MLDKQNKHHAKDSTENKHTSLSSWARANSVSLAPHPELHMCGQAQALSPAPHLAPTYSTTQHCSQAGQGTSTAPARLPLPSRTCRDSTGSSTQPAERWGIPGWGEPLSFHLWMYVH